MPARELEGAPVRRRTRVFRGLLGLWIVATVGIGSTLLARHVLPISTAAAAPERGNLTHLRRVEDADRWVVAHVLYGKCRCSQRILDHLLSTTRPQGVVERVLLVDGAPEASRLADAGFDVETLSAPTLEARYGIGAGPLLVVLGPDGEARYVGGYTERKQGFDVRDLSIIAATIQADPTPSLPLYGCAISQRLGDALDPMGLTR